MNYIVLDLEWNQGNADSEEASEKLPFEIIEIGAVKVSDDNIITGEFNQLIKPEVYHEMNRITSQLIHLQMQELERGKPFRQVAESFLDWCGGEPYQFCIWGDTDLTELQRNMEFYQMAPLSNGPIPFLNVQKLFSLAFEDGKSRKALEYAIDQLKIEKDIPFHRAFGDAFYTAEILRRIMRERPEVLKKVSYDVFHPPADRSSEIKVQFDTYMKYISREFADKAEAFEDKEVVSSKCYLCHRNLRKKLKWFTANGRRYYCLAYCEKHGYLKGKIRIQHSRDDRIYIVKTTKLISPEEAEEIRGRRDHARELRRRHDVRLRGSRRGQSCHETDRK